ncbi:MAG: hypothetical protein HQK49_22415 [Oligoflexia bacterium]|nr:hypothetical protein [Oligoflexia bacterium]
MDLSRYLDNNKIFPIWTKDNLFPTDVRMVLSPQNIIMSFWGSINFWFFQNDVNLSGQPIAFV